jgi:hypothetical protein
VLHNFYDGLTPMSRGHIDAATGGAFFLTIDAVVTELTNYKNVNIKTITAVIKSRRILNNFRHTSQEKVYLTS